MKNLQCLPSAHGSSSRCRRCRSNHCCSWSRCCPTRPSVSTVATRPDVYVYINITTGLNRFGRWFVYTQTIYKQESLARHFKCGQKICRAEDYTPNYIFFKRGTSRVQYRPKNGRINDAAATGSSAAPFSHHTGDMERRRL